MSATLRALWDSLTKKKREEAPRVALGPVATPKPLPVRKSTEPIRAWRQWRVIVRDDDYLLYSYNQSSVWEGPILRANCKPQDHNPHQHGGTEHGIYAWPLIAGPAETAKVAEKCRKPGVGDIYFGINLSFTPGLGQWLIGTNPEPTSVGFAEGEVELIGKVVVHEKGYRAEAARVSSLFLRDVNTPAFRNGIIRKMEARYQCFVAIANDPDWTAVAAPKTEAPVKLLPITDEDIERYGHR